MPLEYCNNLQKDDVVLHAVSKRPGKVAVTPRSDSVMTSVLWQGCTTPVYCYVADLRLVVNGKPEDVPPCDGTPPPRDVKVRAPAASNPGCQDAVATLKKERDSVDAQMRDLEAQFKTLKGRREKLDQAIAVLVT